MKKKLILFIFSLIFPFVLMGCQGNQGEAGEKGVAGIVGPSGLKGDTGIGLDSDRCIIDNGSVDGPELKCTFNYPPLF